MRKQKQLEEIILEPSRQFPERLGYLFMMFYIVGLVIFHTLADFDSSAEWTAAYYLWEQSKDALAVAAIAGLLKQWKLFFSIVVYSIIRVCIEVIITVKGASPNIGLAVNILYWLALAPVVYLTFIQMKKEWHSKSSSP